MNISFFLLGLRFRLPTPVSMISLHFIDKHLQSNFFKRLLINTAVLKSFQYFDLILVQKLSIFLWYILHRHVCQTAIAGKSQDTFLNSFALLRIFLESSSSGANDKCISSLHRKRKASST